MKKIFLLMSLIVMLFSACSEGTDFDIDYTPIAPIGGQYVLNIERGYDPSKTDAEYWASNPTNVEKLYNTEGTLPNEKDGTVVYAYLSNTTDYDKDKAWIRVGSYSSTADWAINAKVAIDMNSYTFGGDNVEDFIGNSATATDKVIVSGKCGHNTYTTVSGTITDEITFTYSRSDQPGWHYKATGFKYTGWGEDTH